MSHHGPRGLQIAQLVKHPCGQVERSLHYGVHWRRSQTAEACSQSSNWHQPKLSKHCAESAVVLYLGQRAVDGFWESV